MLRKLLIVRHSCFQSDLYGIIFLAYKQIDVKRKRVQTRLKSIGIPKVIKIPAETQLILRDALNVGIAQRLNKYYVRDGNIECIC